MTSRRDDVAPVDTQLRSDTLASVAAFRASASEPIWSEWAEPTGTGAQLVLYITNRKDHFGTLGGFWIHALFNFLEDRLESNALAECATTSLCRRTTASEVVQTVQARLGRPLQDAERVAMRVADQQAGLRVFAMLASEAYLAALVEAEDTCIGVFVGGTREPGPKTENRSSTGLSGT
jgi:hypothetical protein